MKIPLQVTFRGLDHSDALAALVADKAAQLDRLAQLISCHVAIESPNHRHQQGRHYRVRIDLTVSGHEVVVDRDPPESALHEDAYQAINHAFDAARRQVLDAAQRRRPRRRSGVLA